MLVHEPVTLDAVKEAREKLKDDITVTPLVELDPMSSSGDILLKLENLHPISSFKMRGAGNKIYASEQDVLADGIWTASAGNMAIAVAWYAKKLALPCTVVVPDFVNEIKLTQLHKLGGEILKIPFADWFEVIQTHKLKGMKGVFVHPVSDEKVMAGNGTIALELLEQAPDLDSIVMPFGLGGLCCGIASVAKAINPDIKVYACESEAAAPFAASLQADKQVEVAYNPSFIEGMGAPVLLPEMWQLAKQLIDDCLVVSLEAVANSVKHLAYVNRVIAEPAGAVSVAAAMQFKAHLGKTACVVSGGNISEEKLLTLLQGQIP